MSNFNIVDLTKEGLEATVSDWGATYTTYTEFAKAAGHLDALGDGRGHLRQPYARVKLLAKGNHGSTNAVLYVVLTKEGNKFLVGGSGLEDITKPLVDVEVKIDEFTNKLIQSHEALLKELQVLREEVISLKAKDESTAPTNRVTVIEEAKALVKKLESNGTKETYCFGGNHTYRNDFYKVSYITNYEKRTVVALVKSAEGLVLERGIAKCEPTDCFNATIGKAIALHRALGLDVPKEFLDAPQPTELRVGNIVRKHSNGALRTVTKLVHNHVDSKFPGQAFHFAEGRGWLASSQVTIVDDSVSN